MHRIRLNMNNTYTLYGKAEIIDIDFTDIEFNFSTLQVIFSLEGDEVSIPLLHIKTASVICKVTGEVWDDFTSYYKDFTKDKENKESGKPPSSERVRKVKEVKRKKINKVKADPKKRERAARLRKAKEENDGFSLNHVLKTGRYCGESVRHVINKDIDYIEKLLNGTHGFKFKLNKRAFSYFCSARKEYHDHLDRAWRERKHKREEELRKEREEQEKRRAENRRAESRKNMWNSHFTDNPFNSNDHFKADWEDLFSRFNWDESSRQRTHNYQHSSGGRTSGKTYLTDEKKYGSILGFSGKVQKSEIKKLWRKAALTWHPDKWENGTPEQKTKAHEKMVEVNSAYDYFKRRYSL